MERLEAASLLPTPSRPPPALCAKGGDHGREEFCAGAQFALSGDSRRTAGRTLRDRSRIQKKRVACLNAAPGCRSAPPFAPDAAGRRRRSARAPAGRSNARRVCSTRSIRRCRAICARYAGCSSRRLRCRRAHIAVRVPSRCMSNTAPRANTRGNVPGPGRSPAHRCPRARPKRTSAGKIRPRAPVWFPAKPHPRSIASCRPPSKGPTTYRQTGAVRVWQRRSPPPPSPGTVQAHPATAAHWAATRGDGASFREVAASPDRPSAAPILLCRRISR